ncbi:MAG: proton-conducting transporter membrane subunit [Thermofilaceae archaeon]
MRLSLVYVEHPAIPPLLVLFAAAAGFPLLSLIPRVGRALAIGVCVAAPYIALALLLMAAPSILQGPAALSAYSPAAPFWAPLEFRVDSLALLLATLTCFVSALSLTFGTRYLSPHNRAYSVQSHNRSYPLALLMTASLVGLYFSNNALTLVIFWELASLCTYALIAFRLDSPASARAGLKALLMTHVGGVGLITAVLLLYAMTGSLRVADYAAPGGLDESAFYALAALSLLATLPKAEQYPLHTWFLDGVTAPTTSIVIYSVCGFQASVFLLFRFLQPLYNSPSLYEPVRLAATSLGAFTALAGGIGGLVERNLKRAIAYGKIAGMGFVVIALGLLTPTSAAAALTLIVSHALAFSLLFFAAGSAIYATGEEELGRLGGLYHHMRLTAVGFLVGCLTLASVPSTPEFIGKYLLFQASLEAGYLHLLPVIVLGSLLNAALGARLFYSVFLGGERKFTRIRDPPLQMLAPMLVLSAAILATGSYPKLVLEDWVPPVLAQLGLHGGRDIYEQFYQLAGTLISLIAAIVIVALAAALAVVILPEGTASGGEDEAEEAAKPFLCGVDMAYAPLPGESVYNRFLSAVKLGAFASSVDPDRFYRRLAKAFLGLAGRALALDIHYDYRASVLAFLVSALILLVIGGVLAWL